MSTFTLHAAAVALAAAVWSAGCGAPPRTYFVPSRTRAQTIEPAVPQAPPEPVATRQFVPLAYAREDLRIACEARAAEDEPIDGVAVASVRVRIWIYNYSRRHVELRPTEFFLVDDIDRRFTPSETRVDGRRSGIALAKAPVRSAIDLVFRLPEGYDTRATRSIRLFWGFRIDDEEYRHETVFEPTRDRHFRDPFAPVSYRSS